MYVGYLVLLTIFAKLILDVCFNIRYSSVSYH